MKRIIFYVFLISLFLASCESSRDKDNYVIGFSQTSLADLWRQTMVREMEIEMSNYDNLELIVKDAQSSPEKQVEDINELIDAGVDVLIVSSIKRNRLNEVVDRAYEESIPLIVIDGKIDGDKYDSFIGVDNYKVGQAAGRYVTNLLKGHDKVNIVELWGDALSSPAIERNGGFANTTAELNANIIPLYCNWNINDAKEALTQIEPIIGDIDVIYAHNDFMAIVASDFIEEFAPSLRGKIEIIGVDAIVGVGLNALVDGKIDVSFSYPTAGNVAISTAYKILMGESVDKYIEIDTYEIKAATAQTLISQSKKIEDYQQSIESKGKKLEAFDRRFSFLENSLSIIIILCITLIVALIQIFGSRKKIAQNNEMLKVKSEQEHEQNIKLLALKNEVEEATAEKLRFFTNISHEFRTPLTLIINPVEKLLHQLEGSEYQRDLTLIHKNSHRLLRDINLLLDSRKLENNKQTINVQPVNVLEFVAEIKSYFDVSAREKQISYTIEDSIEMQTAIFDSILVEKAITNLLSNAFKFTKQGGTITILVENNDEHFKLSVRDNGQGIAKDDLPYIFDRFFTTTESTGTGIGLHLAKELISLHGGTIIVDSVREQYTIFTITLPTAISVTNFNSSIDEGDFGNEKIEKLVGQRYDYHVLVVEDNSDVRTYMLEELSGLFNVSVAENGEQALKYIENNEVSLIISDVMMPVMNGYELCAKVKQDVRFSHIPIIILTALSGERQRLFSVVNGADAYISKPFQMEYLKVKSLRLIESQQKLYRTMIERKEEKVKNISSSPQELVEEEVSSIDDAFINKLMTILERVYSDSEYNIERLSDEMSMSRGHLYRKIKGITTLTPVDFLREYRLKRAYELLRDDNLNVNEVAYSVGFSSPSYFSKCFKKLFGVTPTEV